jgi:HK97 family phage portal protein
MKIFGYEINKAKAEEETIDDPRVRGVYMPYYTFQNVIPLPSDFTAMVNAYKSWVYICANKNSNSVANVPIRLYAKKKSKKQKFIVKTKSIDFNTMKRLQSNSILTKKIADAVEVEEVLEHPFLDLLERVNPMQSRFDLWDMTQLFLELTGNSYWYIIKDKLGTPSQIWPIPPQYMKVVTSKETLIYGYVFEFGARKVPFDYDEIIHYKFSSPLSQLYGTGPLSAVFETYIVDQNIRRYDTALLSSGGKPDGVLQTEQNLSEREFERLRDQWKQRYGDESKAGKTLILEKGLKYQPITFTPKEMNYVVGRKLNREEIAAAFGVPLSKLTTEQVNLANAYAGEKQYAQDTIEPRLRRLEEKINERIMPMYDDGESLFVAYDSSVPEDREFEAAERQRRLGSYMSSINEEREKLGMSSVEWGDKPLTGPGIAPLGSQPQGAPTGTGPSPSGGNVEPGANALSAAATDGDLSGMSDGELDSALAAMNESKRGIYNH